MSELNEIALVETTVGNVPIPTGIIPDRDPWLVLFDEWGRIVGTVAFAHDGCVTGVSRGAAQFFWNTNAHYTRNLCASRGWRVETVSEREREQGARSDEGQGT